MRALQMSRLGRWLWRAGRGAGARRGLPGAMAGPAGRPLHSSRRAGRVGSAQLQPAGRRL